MTDGATSLPPTAISSVVDAIGRGEPWRRALQAAIPSRELDDALESIASEACGNWVWLTSFERREAALDVAGVVSSMVNALARHFTVVHHVESSPLLAEFAAKRFAQDRLANVTVSRASPTRLPFDDDAFDCVTLHGTISRIARTTDGSVAPDILAECSRVLRPRGRVYLSFDNPVWYGGFAKRGTRRELERLIIRLARLAGFRDVSRFYAFPSFDRPRAIVPGTRRAFYARETVEARGTIRRAVRRAAAYAGLYPMLAPSLVIVASK